MLRGIKTPLRLLLVAAVATAAACDDSSGDPQTEPVMLDLEQYPLDLLSDYNYFVGELEEQAPNEGVIPYTVNAPLWADGADKGRFFALPEGGKITWTEQDEWVFPAGSVFIKNFYFDQDRGPAEDLKIIETRLLVLSEEGEWDSHIYLWDDDQTEAEYIKAGADIFVDYIDENGIPQEQLYLVPDRNTCETCHQRDDAELILGPTTHQLNTQWEIEGEMVNQIDYLREAGLFANDVPPAAALPLYPNPASQDAHPRRAGAGVPARQLCPLPPPPAATGDRAVSSSPTT